MCVCWRCCLFFFLFSSWDDGSVGQVACGTDGWVTQFCLPVCGHTHTHSHTHTHTHTHTHSMLIHSVVGSVLFLVIFCIHEATEVCVSVCVCVCVCVCECVCVSDSETYIERERLTHYPPPPHTTNI